jgi:hypothetical protein
MAIQTAMLDQIKNQFKSAKGMRREHALSLFIDSKGKFYEALNHFYEDKKAYLQNQAK